MCGEKKYFQVRRLSGEVIHMCKSVERAGHVENDNKIDVDILYHTLCGRTLTRDRGFRFVTEDDAGRKCVRCLSVSDKLKEEEVLVLFNEDWDEWGVFKDLEQLFLDLTGENDYDPDEVAEALEDSKLRIFRAARVMVEPVVDGAMEVVGLTEVKSL